MSDEPQLPEDIFTTTDKVLEGSQPPEESVNAPKVSPITPPPPKAPPSPTPVFEKKPTPQNLDEAIAAADREVTVMGSETEGVPTPPGPESIPDIFMPSTKTPSTPALTEEQPSAKDREPKEERSSLKVAILLIIGFIFIAGGVTAGYYYFEGSFASLLGNKSAPPLPTPAAPETKSGDVMEKKEESSGTGGEVMEKKPVQTSAWLVYTDADLGITFKYPETMKITSDTLPKNSSAATTNTSLIIENSDASERLVLWAHPQGLAAFTIPTGGELNPLSAGTQLILKREGGGLAVSRTSYQSFSGVVSPNASYLVAYTSDIIGGVRYVMLYTGLGDATIREETLKAIVASVTLKVDTDGDGLFDEEEKTYGTDPTKADTDGDTFSDGVEVQNGYNPLGEGKLK